MISTLNGSLSPLIKRGNSLYLARGHMEGILALLPTPDPENSVARDQGNDGDGPLGFRRGRLSLCFASIVNVDFFHLASTQQRLNDGLGHVGLFGTVVRIHKQAMHAVEKQVERRGWSAEPSRHCLLFSLLA